ncbi:MAG: hypothetical protein ACRD1K_20770 [Acidimicrobiales bacterium]
MTTVADVLVHELSLASYQASIRAAVRGLWNGALGEIEFVDSMISASARGTEQAWREGAKECGVGPDERTPQEEAALVAIQNRNLAALRSFATTIAGATRASGAPLQPHLNRAELWVNRYNEARNQARAMACADQKYAWEVGPTEHCGTCLKMNGKVKRASTWAEADIRPQHPNLECGGFRCQCSFRQTSDSLSRGPLPGMP